MLTEEPRFSFVKLPRKCDNGNEPRLMLKIEFFTSLDDTSEFLAVQHSTYGLWIRPERKRPRPVFRIEYNRDARNKPQVHMQLHAESQEFGWIDGSAGLAPRKLQDFHFPLGGRRFRPTVEDLLMFLDREKIYVDWLPGWEAHIEESLRDWEDGQARATVRRHPEAAANQLEGMGYRITPPSGSPS